MPRLPLLIYRLVVFVSYLGLSWAPDGLAAEMEKRPQAGEPVFNAKRVLSFQIEIEATAVETLRKAPREEVQAILRVEGRAYTNVTIHLKGRTGSFRSFDDKPSLTLDFSALAPSQRMEGLSKLHLNNSVEDPAYVNEYLGTGIFRAAGIPAPRVAHATVEINQRQLGLYVLKEGFGPEFLQDHFQGAHGNLYENAPTDDDPGAMRRISGSGPEDQSDLLALKVAAAEPDLSRRWQRLEQVMDLDQFLSFMAIELMIGHRDGYCLAANNYRLYRHPGDGRFRFLPHGMDQLFGRADLPLRAQMGGPVAQAVMEMPQGRRLYLERAAALFPRVLRVEHLTNEVRELTARLQQGLSKEASAELEQHSRLVTDRIIRRCAQLAKQLQQPEIKPLQFTNGVAKLQGWRAVDPPEGGRLLQNKAPDGRMALQIQAGPTTSASWRIKVLLTAGRYRFEGAVKTAAVKPLAFGKNKGAGLRLSNVKQPAPHQLVGDTPWKRLAVECELTAPETEVELLCELRASAGEAWFDLDSLQLLRLP